MSKLTHITPLKYFIVEEYYVEEASHLTIYSFNELSPKPKPSQRQIGGSHNAYFKQESYLYLLLKEIQLFVW